MCVCLPVSVCVCVFLRLTFAQRTPAQAFLIINAERFWLLLFLLGAAAELAAAAAATVIAVGDAQQADEVGGGGPTRIIDTETRLYR